MAEKLKELGTILADATHALVTAYRLDGSWEEAVQLIEAVLQVDAEPPSRAMLQIQMSDMLIKWAHYERAGALLHDALNIAKTHQNQDLLSEALFQQGELLYCLRMLRKEGAYEKALDYHQQALVLRRQGNNQPGIVDSMSRIGVLHERMKDQDKALECYEEALELAEKIDYLPGLNRSLMHIATYHQQKGYLQQALEQFQMSLEVSEAAGDIDGVMFGLGNLGQILYRVNKDADEALPYIKEALELAEKIDHRLAIWVMAIRTGDIYADNDNPFDAKKYYQQAYDTAYVSRLSVLEEPVSVKLNSIKNKIKNQPE